MGTSYSVNLTKVKSKNPVGFRIIRKRRQESKKSIPRKRNTTKKRYTKRRDCSILD